MKKLEEILGTSIVNGMDPTVLLVLQNSISYIHSSALHDFAKKRPHFFSDVRNLRKLVLIDTIISQYPKGFSEDDATEMLETQEIGDVIQYGAEKLVSGIGEERRSKLRLGIERNIMRTYEKKRLAELQEIMGPMKIYTRKQLA